MLSKDVSILFLLRILRLLAFAGSALILSLFLSELGFPDARIGMFMTATLIGDVVISMGTALIADSLGRRWMLAVGSVLMAGSGAVFATCSNFWLLLVASVLGVISPTGGDIGPFKSIEESTMSHLVISERLSGTLAWYYTLGTFGASAGQFATGWLLQFFQKNDMSTLNSYRIIFWLYAAIGLCKTFLTVFLSKDCEAHESCTSPSTQGSSTCSTETEPLLLADKSRATPLSTSPESRHFLLRFCPIIILDNVGTGLSTDSWLTYFVRRSFPSVSNGLLGSVFGICSIIVSVSNILAVPVVSRIGILRTMLLGHGLASTFLIILPLVHNFEAAVASLAARAIFLDFDQATRQTFIARSIPSHERTAALGIINVVRTLAQSTGPTLTGFLAQKGQLGLSFVLAGALKWAYDVLLAVVFLWRKSTV